MMLATKQLLFLCRRVAPAAAAGWIAGAARPKRIAGVGVGTICHDVYLSCDKFKLGVLLDARYALTALPADSTARWKTCSLPRKHQKEGSPI